MRKHSIPDLSRYTKEELIELVKAVSNYENHLHAGDTIRYCLIGIESRRTKRKLEEAYAHSEAADAARKRYIELVRPYQGKPYSDIPLQTLKEMQKCLEEAAREETIFLRLSEAIEREIGGRV